MGSTLWPEQPRRVWGLPDQQGQAPLPGCLTEDNLWAEPMALAPSDAALGLASWKGILAGDSPEGTEAHWGPCEAGSGLRLPHTARSLQAVAFSNADTQHAPHSPARLCGPLCDVHTRAGLMNMAAPAPRPRLTTPRPPAKTTGQKNARSGGHFTKEVEIILSPDFQIL